MSHGRFKRVVLAIAVRIALFAASLVFCGLALELGVRVLAPQQLVLLRPDIWIPEDGLGWRHAPNLDTVVNTGERAVRLRTDGAGHRIGGAGHRVGVSSSVAGPRFRLLALGDSFIAALEVENEQTLTSLLAEGATRRLGVPVAIDNTAVGGYGPSHYLLQARHYLSSGAYDLTLVFLFLGNDIETRRVERFGPKEPSSRPLRWPRSLGRKEWLDAVAYPINNALETRSHVFVLFKQRAWSLLMRLGLSARRFPEVLLRSEAESKRWALTGESCSEIAAVAREHGVPVWFVLLPGAYQVDPALGAIYARSSGIPWDEVDLEQPARLLRPELEGRGLIVIDATRSLQVAQAAGLEPYGRIDTHFSPAGHAAVAGLLEKPLAEALAGRATVTTEVP